MAKGKTESKNSLLGVVKAMTPEFVKDLGEAVKAPFHEIAEAFTVKEDKEGGRPLSETAKKGGYTIGHASKTVLHRLTFQMFRLNTWKGLIDEESYSAKSDKTKEVFGKIKELANNGPENGGFENAHQAWENFNQMERRFGRGALNPEAKAEIIAAKAAIQANYGPPRSWMELLTCDSYSGDRLAGIIKEAESQNYSIEMDVKLGQEKTAPPPV